MILKFSYANDTIEGGPMMCMSSTMDGNRPKRKLTIEHKVLKWDKTNSASPKGSLWQVPWQMGSLWHHFHNYDDYKTREIQMHKMGEQKRWIVWHFHLLHEILELWPFLTPNWKLWQINWY